MDPATFLEWIIVGIVVAWFVLQAKKVMDKQTLSQDVIPPDDYQRQDKRVQETILAIRAIKSAIGAAEEKLRNLDMSRCQIGDLGHMKEAIAANKDAAQSLDSLFIQVLSSSSGYSQIVGSGSSSKPQPAQAQVAQPQTSAPASQSNGNAAKPQASQQQQQNQPHPNQRVAEWAKQASAQTGGGKISVADFLKLVAKVIKQPESAVTAEAFLELEETVKQKILELVIAEITAQGATTRR